MPQRGQGEMRGAQRIQANKIVLTIKKTTCTDGATRRMSQWRTVGGGKALKWLEIMRNESEEAEGGQIICKVLQRQLCSPPPTWATVADEPQQGVYRDRAPCPAACVLCHSSVEMRFIDPRTVNCRGTAQLGHGHRPCPDPQQMWWQPAAATAAAAQIVNAWLPLWQSCVCPVRPVRPAWCPSTQSRTCRPVGTAPNGAKVKVPQLERIKTNFTLFPTLPLPCLFFILANWRVCFVTVCVVCGSAWLCVWVCGVCVWVWVCRVCCAC